MNLAASAPRTTDGKPDLTGIWRMEAGAGVANDLTATLKSGETLPWAQALYRQRIEDVMKDDPDVQCLPSGPRRMINGNFAKFVQTPSLLVTLYEALVYRQVFLDGRAPETDPNPSWMGYSVGRWEGDTLVVETAGYNERTWLDESGHPHTEALRTTERFTRRDFGHMDVQVTYNDPKTYTRPWSVSFTADLRPDTELLEEVCAENNRSPAHIVGRTSEEKKVTVGPDVLARYAGTYAVVSTTDPDQVVTAYRFRISEGRLMMDIDGSGNMPMIPLTESTFASPVGGTYEFVKDSRGNITHMQTYGVGTSRRAARR